MRFTTLAPYVAIGLLALGLMLSVNAQSVDTSCQQAAKWHYKQALYFSEALDQSYHLKAAQAAEALDPYGASECDGWSLDAHRPGDDGNSNADSLNVVAVQESRSNG